MLEAQECQMGLPGAMLVSILSRRSRRKMNEVECMNLCIMKDDTQDTILSTHVFCTLNAQGDHARASETHQQVVIVHCEVCS